MLWLLPLQQVVYRQLMYAVLIRSVVAAAGTRRGLPPGPSRAAGGAGPALNPTGGEEQEFRPAPSGHPHRGAPSCATTKGHPR